MAEQTYAAYMQICAMYVIVDGMELLTINSSNRKALILKAEEESASRTQTGSPTRRPDSEMLNHPFYANLSCYKLQIQGSEGKKNVFFFFFIFGRNLKWKQSGKLSASPFGRQQLNKTFSQE